MKSSKKRTLKKVFANVTIGLLIVAYFGNTIAGQLTTCSGTAMRACSWVRACGGPTG